MIGAAEVKAERLVAIELTRFVSEFRACVTAAAEAHGGVIDKFAGDSAMVVFGIPEPGPHDAKHAPDCGEVFCGAVGDAARLEFTALGDAVNVAARIEQHTKTAGHPLLVSRALIEAAGVDPDREPWHALPQVSLRGHSGTIDLFSFGSLKS